VDEMEVVQAIPIFRMFDEAKAREFYVDYLGFSVAFDHRFEASAPLYMGLTLCGFELHLSEHYGDATPISSVRLEVADLAAFHAKIDAKKYAYARPDIQKQEWGFDEVILPDPFGNRLVFCQPHSTMIEARANRKNP